jgi:biopolymer transport protein ExbD
MMDDFFERPHRKHVKDLNLVPVIDMFTTVVFFLLLSTSLMAFTKLTLPPAQVDVISQPQPIPPLAPKIAVGTMGSNQVLKFILSWEGKEPGEDSDTLSVATPEEAPEQIRKKVEALVKKFADKYPAEKSIRLSLTPNVPYQYLISAMDGVRDRIQDVVLTSYEEASAKLNSASSGSGG